MGEMLRADGGAELSLGRSVERVMSIDKDSTGLPEVNLHHDDTKINLGIIVGVLVFLGAMAGAAWAIFG